MTTRVEGTPRSLPREVDLAAFRIVQEALTNVTRHADDARALVAITYGGGDLTVQVDDDGRATPMEPSSSGGKGIAGMRERVAAFAGEFEAGPLDGRGFRVRARFPLGTDRSERMTT